MPVFKVKYQNQTRRVAFKNKNTLYSDLKSFITSNHGDIKTKQLFYLDDEDDLIAFSSNHELIDAVELNGGKNVKIFVEDKGITPSTASLVSSGDESSFEFVSNETEESVKSKHVNDDQPIIDVPTNETPQATLSAAVDSSVKVEDNDTTPKPSKAETQKAKTADGNDEVEDIERFVCLLIDFLQQDNINDTLIRLIGDLATLFTSITDSDDDEFIGKVISVLATKEYDDITKHDFYQLYFKSKMVPLLLKRRSFLPHIAHKITMIQPMLGTMVPKAVQVVISVLSGVLDVVQNYDEKSQLNWSILHEHVHEQLRRNMMPLLFQGMMGGGHGRGRGRCGGRRQYSRCQPVHEANTATTDVKTEATTPVESWLVRAQQKAICDGCKKSITSGFRFISTDTDYDLCDACEATNSHASNLNLVRVKIPFEAIHFNVECDVCHVKPIRGVRFKSGIWDNYDICASCEEKGALPDGHPLIKIRQPTGKTARPFNGLPTVGPTHVQGWAFRRGGRRHCMRNGHGAMGPKKMIKKAMKQLFKATKPCFVNNDEQKHMKQQMKKIMKEAIECNSAAPSNSRKRETRGLKVKYIEDTSIPDNVIVAPNQTLIKTWKVANMRRPWPQGTKLIFLRGDREVSVSEEYEVPLASGGKKEEVLLNAVIITPPKPGKYSAYYSLADENRLPFGPRLWVTFEVQIPEVVMYPDEDDIESKQLNVLDEKPSAPPANVITKKEEALPVAPVVEKEQKVEKKAESIADLAKSLTLNEKETKWSKEIALLNKMGFKSQQVNIALLEVFNGNIAKVLEELFQNQ